MDMKNTEAQPDLGFRADFMMEERLTAVHDAQLLTYMKRSGCGTQGCSSISTPSGFVTA
jgi:hypothetical protein